MGVSGKLHASTALSPQKEPPVPIGEDAGWNPESVWPLWNREKSLVPAMNQTQDLSLYRFNYSGSNLSHIKILFKWIIENKVCGRIQNLLVSGS
jgi:hypothetical protein